jgi:hypothetical protein
MLITDQKKLAEIQREFQDEFPYLKIEFYKHQHETGEGSPEKEILDPDLTIGAVRHEKVTGDFKIDKGLRVGEFENNFFEQYGLNVQVFRKSGRIWLQTISTDAWTLEEQNIKGERSARYSLDEG